MYGGESHDYASCVKQTTDGGYILTGFTESYGTGVTDVWLIKTDSMGDTLWTKTFGGSNGEEGRSVQQTKDGGYIIVGDTYSFGAGDRDVWVLKTNVSGDTLWTRTYGGPSGDGGWSVQQTKDGGYILAGYTSSFGTGQSNDVWLIKTDANGDTLWTKTFDRNYDEWATFVQQTTDDGYIITGSTGLWSPVREADVWLIKTNSIGDTLWTKTYGDSGYSVGITGQQTADGGYFLVETNGCWFYKTDSIGSIIWSKQYDAFSTGGMQTSDGGYAVLATMADSLCIIKTDPSGESLWNKYIDGDNSGFGKSIQQTADGGYIVLGDKERSDPDNRDFWLIKLAPEPSHINSDKKFIEPKKYVLTQNYPNPFNPVTMINYQLPMANDVELSIYNLLGQKVATLVSERQDIGAHEVDWDASGIASGVYYYRLEAGEFVDVKKMVLLR
jgi:hypothetical protein